MKNKSTAGSVKSPSNREQTTANCGGQPEKLSVEQIFKRNPPPKTPPSEPITGNTGIRA